MKPVFVVTAGDIFGIALFTVLVVGGLIAYAVVWVKEKRGKR